VRTLMEDVASLRLSYYYYDDIRKAFGWQKMWLEVDEETKIPLAVRVQVKYKEDNEIKTATRTLNIPAAGQFHYE